MGMDDPYRGEQEKKASETYVPSPVWSQWTKSLREPGDTEESPQARGRGRGAKAVAEEIRNMLLFWAKAYWIGQNLGEFLLMSLCFWTQSYSRTLMRAGVSWAQMLLWADNIFGWCKEDI